MMMPTWPELELSPLEEYPLLEAARLRRFGVNYLQDAVCPGLGLLAHLDGSHVRLMALSPQRSPGELADAPLGCIVANIDLEAGRKISNPSRKREAGRNDLEEDEGSNQAFTASQGPARGLSWGRCVCSTGAVAASFACGGSSMSERGPIGLTGGSIGMGAVGGEKECGENGEDRVGGERVCHIAVACGSEVLLWKVSRVSCDAGMTSGAASLGDGGKPAMRFRYTAVNVLTDWHRATHNNDGDDGSKDLRSLRGNIRCLSFRPCVGAGSADVSAAEAIVGRDVAVPLTTWYDGGATVLRPEGSRVVLPAPVIRERACGAWSGCGRRLAISSGGEIRVYDDPSEGQVVSEAMSVPSDGIETVDAPGQRSAKTRSTCVGSDPNESAGSGDSGDLPLATEVRGGWLPVDQETKPADAEGAENTFHTVLCVEAAMYDGGIFSSPGSSPGGTPRSLTPPSARVSPFSSSRRGVAQADRGGAEHKKFVTDHMAADTNASRASNEGVFLTGGQGSQNSSRTTCGSTAVAPATSMRGSSSPPLVGNMRAMCPAGPLAFFGATDGGLGLDSVVATTRTIDLSETPTAGSSGGGTGMGGQDLLGAIKDTSSATLPTAWAATGGGGFEKSTRRSGFRHVLPGENWLAGSLRPSSRRPPDSPPRQRHLSSPETSRQTERTKLTPAAGSDKDDAWTEAVQQDTEGRALQRPVAEPEVLDLRGKLGEGGNVLSGGVDEGKGATMVSSVHPLFRLALPGGAAPRIPSVTGSETASRHEGFTCDGRASSSAKGDSAPTPVRSPWLVRVSCKSKSSRSIAIGHSVGSKSVKVKALASLPPGLASPDLIASSRDGGFVAVGSHACDLVACFRLELHSSDAFYGDPAEKRDAKSSTDCSPPSGGEGKGNTGKGGSPRRRQRRTVPLCTLRLPRGYRAKGLSVVREQKTAGGHHDTFGANVARNSSKVSGEHISDDVVVLVLAGSAVPDADAVIGGASRSCASDKPRPAGSYRRGSTGEEVAYRTVLLRFLLPSGSPAGDAQVLASLTPAAASSQSARGEDSLRGGRGISKTALDGRKNPDPPNIALVGGRDPASGCGLSTSTMVSGRRSSPSNAVGVDESNAVDGCGGNRLEAAVLEAIAGVERRMDDRFGRMEAILAGVCDRMGTLEAAVKGQLTTR